MDVRRRALLASGGVVALGAFIALAWWVTYSPAAVPRLDQSWHDALRAYGAAHPAWRSVTRAITHIGDTVTIVVVDVLLFVVCLVRRRRVVAALVAVVGLGGWALRIEVRDLVGRPRPTDPLWSADGDAFPSGHTTNASLMVALVVIVVWPLANTAARWALVAGALVVALAVGFSRVAGGVHWPTDVLGGWLLALAVLSLVAAAFPWRAASGPPSTEDQRRRPVPGRVGPKTG
jgi:undecaprenyl-diphosphatase